MNNNAQAEKSLAIGGIASVNNIELIWPEPEYYYVTDALNLEIDTINPSTCSYSFNGGGFQLMEDTGGTTHTHILYDLLDNMESDEPYIVDFKCLNGGVESSAETYFWINTTDLERYLIRNDLGDWDYIYSEIFWEENEFNIMEEYRAFYDKSINKLITKVGVLIFDNEDSTNNLINIILNETNKSIVVLNNYNYYSFNDNDGDYILWKNGEKLIYLFTYKYENNTFVNTTVPLQLIDLYLDKYPSDIRNGFCGDEKINVLNLQGFREECDSNFLIESCSVSVGLCTEGERRRECSQDCTWDDWKQCIAIGSSDEICDGEDNNCDGQTDEKDICADNIFEFNVNSPIVNIYNTTKIQFNITLNNKVDKLLYTDSFDLNQKEILLCKNCDEYGLYKKKVKTFKDGQHNLTIKAIKNNESADEVISFFIDSKKPKITKIEPKQNSFTNGSGFLVKYTEDNVNNVILNFDSGLSIRKDCLSGKDQECRFDIDLEDFDDQELEYWFEIEDISGNKAKSKLTKVKVDTTPPIINNFSYNLTGKNLLFTLNMTEKNFREINYVDLSESLLKERRLCSKLNNNICRVKKTFKIGEHNLRINVIDKSGNIAEVEASFVIV